METENTIIKSIRLSSSEIKTLKDIDICDETSFTYNVKNVINITDVATRETCKEIEKIFTENETALLCQSLNGTLINNSCTEFNLKKMLIVNVKESMEYDSLDTFYGVESKIIIRKLERLTYFQAVCVVKIILDFWRIEHKKDFTDLIICKKGS